MVVSPSQWWGSMNLRWRKLRTFSAATVEEARALDISIPVCSLTSWRAWVDMVVQAGKNAQQPPRQPLLICDEFIVVMQAGFRLFGSRYRSPNTWQNKIDCALALPCFTNCSLATRCEPCLHYSEASHVWTELTLMWWVHVRWTSIAYMQHAIRGKPLGPDLVCEENNLTAGMVMLLFERRSNDAGLHRLISELNKMYNAAIYTDAQHLDCLLLRFSRRMANSSGKTSPQDYNKFHKIPHSLS